ncbi:MAG TPA: cysteine desulfurase [Mogibacterium sp.]|nr:cysteine desulfurase [Mogibacterium sp.]
MIYLDNSATTRQYDEVTDLQYRMAKENFGNPSSLHSMGFESGNFLYDARKQIEDEMFGNGVVIFTSGGTESVNMALSSTAYKMRRRGNQIITTKIEHPAVLETCKRLEAAGFIVDYLDVDETGCLNTEILEKKLSKDTILVSIMTVNNETGIIEPVIPAFKSIKKYNEYNNASVIFHTDAVQAFGKIKMDAVPFDLISASGHKFHGPKGTGFLYMNKNLKLPPFICGGGQEEGYRSGTENTIGIAGLGLATKLIYENQILKIHKLGEVNDYLWNGIKSEIKDIKLNGPEELGYSLYDYSKRCPSVLNVSFFGTRGEVLLHTLEQDNIFVSTGSACSAKKSGDSHVLKAMGRSHKEIEGALRFSLSEFNTIEEMDTVIYKVKNAVQRFRQLGSFR